MTPDQLHPGDIIRIGPAAGPACRPMTARVIRVQPGPTYEGMAFLDIHELDETWHAVEKRMAYVALEGITVVRTAAEAAENRARFAEAARRNRIPAAAVRIPQQRRSPEPTGRNR